MDGFSALFYQKLREIIKLDVCSEILNFLNHDTLDANINITQIILIPKKEVCKRVEDYRPISLCNVIMKLITKVIAANRLSEILPFLISENQSAFLKHRLITDNVLVTNEAIHYVRQKKVGLTGFLSIKVDMRKAYDRVEWGFLQQMLYRLGFPHNWINKTMKCVKSVSYKLKVNGYFSETFSHQRGLRQCDPLSPYLFLLCQEWLSCHLNDMQTNGRIEGIKMVRDYKG